MLLAQILGLYFIIIGIIVLYRRRAIMPAVSRLVANRPMLLVIAAMEIFAGIALMLTYPSFEFDVSGVISVIGWMLLIEGVIYLVLPWRRVQRLVRRFNKASWYGASAILSLVIGIYLAGSGFGFF